MDRLLFERRKRRVTLSPLRKVRIIRKWKILDDIFIFRTSVMPEHQGVENNGNIAKRAVSRYYDFLEWAQHLTFLL
jgi:hypothetical protein